MLRKFKTAEKRLIVKQCDLCLNFPKYVSVYAIDMRIVADWGGGGGGGAMAKNGDGEFGFFICQIRHFSPTFHFGISDLIDF